MKLFQNYILRVSEGSEKILSVENGKLQYVATYRYNIDTWDTKIWRGRTM